jgi:hypothetical protein
MGSWVLKCVAVGGCAAVLAIGGACSSSANVPNWPSDDGGGSGGSGSGSGGESSGSGSGSGSGGASSNGGSGGTSSGSSGGGGSNSGSGSTSSSSGGGSGSSSGSSDPITAARQQCVKTINDYRATLNPPSAPLAENTAEETCVDGQAQADATSGTPHSAFGNCQEYAQNECPGWPGPPAAIMGYMSMSCLDQMWAEGPPPQGQDNHWLNMENPQYTKVACGFYQDSQGTWWATQDFW